MADELVFTCINSGRIAAWDVSSGAVRRNYSGDIDGGGCVCLLGKDFLLCALWSLPFIYVWNVRKVSTFAVTQGWAVLSKFRAKVCFGESHPHHRAIPGGMNPPPP